MQLFRHFFESAMNRELSELYVTHALRAFAAAMISIFVPIYLFQLQYSIFQIIYYFILSEGFMTVFILLTSLLAKKLPLKHMMAISVPLHIVFLLMLYTFDSVGWGLELLALFDGAAVAFYWLPFHLDFSQNSLHDFRGREVGLLQTATVGVTLLAPIVGGTIVVLLGFHWLYIAGIVLMISSIIPLFLSKEIFDEPKFSFKDSLNFPAREALMHFAWGARTTAELLFWPLFLFVLLNSAFTLGLITTIGALFSALATLWDGKITDSLKRNVMVSIATIVESVSWFVRIITTTILGIIGISIVSGAAFTSIDVPYRAFFYDQTNKTKRSEYIIFRQLWLFAGRLFILGILLLAGLSFTNTLVAGMLMTSIILLAFLFLVKERTSWN